MSIWEFLQWLSVGGISILGFIATSKGKSKANEHAFIDQLQEELKRRDDRLDNITKRLDDLEGENSTLKELNYKLQIERDIAINAKLEAQKAKENIERELISKVEKLVEENRLLRERVLKLEKDINGSSSL